MWPSLLHLGPLTLHTYGLMIAVGFLIGMSVLRRTTRPLGLVGDRVDRLALLMLDAGLVGARVMYFAVDGFAGLSADPLSFFRIWEGGLAFYGGVIGAFVAALIYARRRQVRLLALTDALVPPLLIAHAFGRIGCLAAGCCYGRPTNAWFGITFHHPDSLAPTGVPLFPSQPLEALVLGGLFAVAVSLFKRSLPTGWVTAFYLCAYAVMRFLLEFMRGDDRGMFVAGLSPSQAVAVVMFAAGLGLFWYAKRPQAD